MEWAVVHSAWVGADLSAPYICEELQICPHSSCNATGACVKIHGVDVTPKSAAVGSVFHVVANYSVLNAKIGTGALVLNVDGPLTAGEVPRSLVPAAAA